MQQKTIHPGMRVAIVAGLLLALVLTIWLKGRGAEDPSTAQQGPVNGTSVQGPVEGLDARTSPQDPGVVAKAADSQTAHGKALPRLLDLGRGTCIPCKMMMPVLKELRESMQGRMIVQYIDISKDPEAAAPYEVRIIPTQIFFDPDGTELTRHTGFFSREDILAEWKRLGFDFTDPDPGIIDDGGQD